MPVQNLRGKIAIILPIARLIIKADTEVHVYIIHENKCYALPESMAACIYSW